MTDTANKLAALRAEMQTQELDVFLVPRADEYQGEFVPPCSERLAWLSGFTGSAGCAIVTGDRAVLLTDGRYTIQAAQQLDPEHFEAVDITKTPIENWLKENLDPAATIGIDPWLHTSAQIEKLERNEMQIKALGANPLDMVWKDRPAKPQGEITIFPSAIAELSLKEKKQKIAGKLRAVKADACILAMPDSTSWLLNLRGSDVDYIPVVLGYAVIYADDNEPLRWIIAPERITQQLLTHFDGHVEIIAPEHISRMISGLKEHGCRKVMLDSARAPLWFKNELEALGVKTLDAKDPCIDIRARKTPCEIEAIRQTHIIDGIAIAQFLCWLEGEATFGVAGVTETSAAKKLLEFRAKYSAFKGESFPAIAGYGENGAIVHYRATDKTSKPLLEGNLFLLDSGGQYCDEEIAGTTDITRTIAIGEPSDEMREKFTLVLKGHIALAMAKFPLGTTGQQIDTLARNPLWNAGLDYAHGTGHGVGCYLSVHEEAAGISPRGKDAFQPGMLLSNEPGYYKENAFGIRIENLVLVEKTDEAFDGTGAPILAFETVSLAPIDRTLINADMLDESEKDWLNTYHQHVYNKIAPHLEEPCISWLLKATAPL